VTNKKSHMRFRLVPKSTTLDDIEGPLRTVSKHARTPFGAHHENLNEDGSARRCSAMTLVSGNNKVYADIHGRFP